ncbi:hypothetical protein QW131_02845 [Roseibium salinum]|nr:hypothetical protein [Roseibium salinum]
MTTLYIQSTFEDPPEPVCQAGKDGRLTVIRQEDLSSSDFQRARGIITHNQLDQNAFMKLKDALEAFSGSRRTLVLQRPYRAAAA